MPWTRGPSAERKPRGGAGAAVARVLLLVGALALAACHGGTRLALLHDGVERSVVVDRPTGPAGPRPLVVVLHAAMLDGASTRAQLGMPGAAAEAGILLAYPDAGGVVWNDLSLARALPGLFSARDDLGFLDRLIATLVAEGGADPGRIHLAGISNGGMMAARYACRHAERVASLTLFLATMAVEDARDCRPARPLDVLLLAGTEDPVVRWSGEVDMPFLARLQQRMSVPASFAFWRGANGCTGMAPPRLLPRRGEAAEPHVVVHAATGCAGGVRTELYEVRGGGHRLAGDRLPLPWLLGRATPDVEPGPLLVEVVQRTGQGSTATTRPVALIGR